MSDRLRKLKRIQGVQTRLHQLAEQKLVRLQREQEELKRAQVDIVDALNADDAFHGLFVDGMAGRLNRLARESDKVGRAEDMQRKRVREEGLRLKRAERLAGRLDRAEQINTEKRGFRDLLDGIGQDTDASLP
jgi:hypothetical protein